MVEHPNNTIELFLKELEAEMPKKLSYDETKKLVEETDEGAFMIVSDAREVLGNGFSGKNL